MAKKQSGGSKRRKGAGGREVVRRPGAAELDALEATLGYRFAERERLERALTHRSARVDDDIDVDNERLEFLGDRVLGLVIADALMTLFPDEPEGLLTRRLHRLVNANTNAELAREIDVAAALTQAQTPSQRSRATVSVLGDTMEALLGAVYRDGGLDAARTVILKFWGPRLDDDRHLRRDPKSALQEWAQGRGLQRPDYRDTGRTGPDHAPRFVATVLVEGYPPSEGDASSKRGAEQEAAERFLIREGIWEHPEAARTAPANTRAPVKKAAQT